jgi:hypothetical protein
MQVPMCLENDDIALHGQRLGVGAKVVGPEGFEPSTNGL